MKAGSLESRKNQLEANLFMLVALIAEARTDACVCRALSNRVIRESESTPDWIREDSEQFEHEVRFSGLGPDQLFTERRRVKRLAKDRKIQRLRKFGNPVTEDFVDTWRVVALTLADEQGFDAVIISRDTDGRIERRQSWAAVRETFLEAEIEIVIAGAHCKLEAWILNGFLTDGESEAKKLADEREKLGFNPTKKAEKLSATEETAKRSAKRVLRSLAGDDWDRKQKCWTETGLQILHENGKETGLSNFLGEVEEILIPLLDD